MTYFMVLFILGATSSILFLILPREQNKVELEAEEEEQIQL